ncbi:uncharacterized protein EV154DRAFT_518807 [Mucor mucedo]|uniref:uncharacterized protein n=1 Tax=Mucor mucedo TaxID=29922 RepID=UPI00221FAB4B|nr:uncharacterized protein EV154DRAFT_518807 [Mucor mucedo]KAI7888135.1 hypothetical protein EV154DRAFT_518807 [Mucor mucedo]
MFNQKPAFKFVIKSKLEVPNTVSDKKETSVTTVPNPDDRKRKRTEGSAPIATKKIHSQLLKWNKKKEELKQQDLTEAEKQDAKNDFADIDALTCLLCQRKFKSKADLTRHLDLSDLHKNNLKVPSMVSKALLKLNFKSEVKEEQEVEYQRQAYGQPDKPVLSPPASPPRQPSRELAALPKASMYTPIGDDNKGARMLAQMGWKKGEGLGKDGTGILDPVKAESYGQNAGIGSTPKRDAGDGNYRTRTVNVARQRYLGDRK